MIMEMGPGFNQRITGKIKKIVAKKVQPGEKFYTPPCVIYLIPAGTNYFEIFLESKKELIFFEFKKDSGKNLEVGKKYEFNISGSEWISRWKEIDE